MARTRNLKPSIFKNVILGVADPLYTILFEGLWCHADREGRLEDSPMKLKAEIFPYRDLDMDAMLSWLASHKDGKGNPQFIVRYTVEGEKFIQIINFKKHQNPHQKEHASTIPAPDSPGAVPGDSGTDRALTLNPLTLTLNPITTLSGKPDVVRDFKKEAIEVIEFLNTRTGHGYRTVDEDGKPTAGLKAVMARLKSGVSLDDVRSVVAMKCREWGKDAKMAEYLRPKTLFAASNFEDYLGKLRRQK